MLKKKFSVAFFLLFVLFCMPVQAQDSSGDAGDDIKLAIVEDNKSKKEINEPIEGEISLFETTKNFYNELAAKGIILKADYYNDTGFNLGGALNKGTSAKYKSLVNYSATLDLEKMNLIKGGTIFVLGQNIHGKSLSRDRIGDYQITSNIDVPNMTQLTEFWYQQKLLNDKLRVIVGKQDANNEFSALSTNNDFSHTSFMMIPVIPMTTYPATGLGILGAIEPVDWFSLKAGIYDGGAKIEKLGFRTAFDNKDGAVTLVEAGFKPTIKEHAGNYIFGYWCHSGNVNLISEDQTRDFANNYGMYTAFEQMIHKKANAVSDDQGANVFGQFGWRPSDRNDIAKYFGYGISYKGLFNKRPADSIGVGVAMANLSRRSKNINDTKDETAVEVFYKFQLTPYLSIQPDVQMITNSGGTKNNAFAFGIRTVFNVAPKQEAL